MIKIIDVSSYIWSGMGTSFGARAQYKGIPTGGIYGLLQQIALTIKEKDIPVLVYDMPTNAREILPEYKGSRVRNPDVRFQQELVRKYIEPALPNNFRVPNMEADWLAYNVMEKYRNVIKTPLIMRTTDYDWCHNIVTSNEYMIPSTKGYSMIDTSNFTESFSGWDTRTGERYTIPINALSARKVFLGDKSDSIPALKNIGPMSAIKLLNTYLGFCKMSKLDTREKSSMLEFTYRFSGILGDKVEYIQSRAEVIYPRKMENTDSLEINFKETDKQKLTTVCSLTGCKSIANRLDIPYYSDMGSAQSEILNWYKTNFNSNKTQMFEESIPVKDKTEESIPDRGGFIL